MDPRALAVFADAARQLGAELSDADAAEALRYVVNLKHVRYLLNEVTRPPRDCPECGPANFVAMAALELPQANVAVAAAFDDVRTAMAREARISAPLVNADWSIDRMRSLMIEATAAETVMEPLENAARQMVAMGVEQRRISRTVRCRGDVTTHELLVDDVPWFTLRTSLTTRRTTAEWLPQSAAVDARAS